MGSGWAAGTKQASQWQKWAKQSLSHFSPPPTAILWDTQEAT